MPPNICAGIAQMMQVLSEARNGGCRTWESTGHTQVGSEVQTQRLQKRARTERQLGLRSFPLACTSPACRERVSPSPTRILGVSLHVGKDERKGSAGGPDMA